MLPTYQLIIQKDTGDINIVESNDNFEDAKRHADRIAALKGNSRVDLVKSKTVYVGDGKSYVENTDATDFLWGRQLYKNSDDFDNV